MKYSKETLLLAELCWHENEIRSTSVRIGLDYTYKGVQYKKISELHYQELMNYQDKAEKKFKVTRFGNVINLMGVAG